MLLKCGSPLSLNVQTEDEVPSSTEVDLFMSTQRIKVLNADTQVNTVYYSPLHRLKDSKHYVAGTKQSIILVNPTLQVIKLTSHQ